VDATQRLPVVVEAPSRPARLPLTRHGGTTRMRRRAHASFALFCIGPLSLLLK
jgi:hypothetical protein